MKKSLAILLSFFPYLIVFVASLYPPSDLDLGWHLKYGEYFFAHGQILRDNTFSTMMPDYHWINHSWTTDILMYAIFHTFGFSGLSVVAAAIIALTFFFFSKAARLSLWEEAILFPFLLFLHYPLDAVSFRPQLLSLLFLGFLFFVISLYTEQEAKKLLLTVPLFLIWTNVHGEFIMGLVLFLFWIILTIGLKVYKNGMKLNKAVFRQTRTLSLIFSLDVAVTFVNPFGAGIYVEIFRHFNNPMQKYIIEWQPIPLLSQFWWIHVSVAILLFFGIWRLYATGRFKEEVPSIFFACMFFVLALWARRYAWPAYYVMLPVLSPVTQFPKPNKMKPRFFGTVGILVTTLVFVLVLKFPFSDVFNYSWDKYCQRDNVACSPESAEFLSQHHLNNNLFSDYGWGGWLIWNYPDIKPTIDGRMPFWEDKNGYSGFKEYYWYVQNFSDIDKSNYDVVYVSPSEPIYERMEQLVEEGKWRLVYQDRYAGIFVRTT